MPVYKYFIFSFIRYALACYWCVTYGHNYPSFTGNHLLTFFSFFATPVLYVFQGVFTLKEVVHILVKKKHKLSNCIK